ncbi:MAG TPA: hypothetical protein PLJ35_17950 [Anaerolineae bacterium]|nr:hypothetical protein [Anaerolineae bacterium]HOR00700.1 hypothetical protein [Anaerolineae bacterium]HPL28431.1 hypothetical protein [Anaerolineae bacterium]
METTESRGSFGTIVLILLLTLAFLVGTALFGYVGYQLLAGGSGGQTAGGQAALAGTPTPTPTGVPPTSAPSPTTMATMPATPVPAIQATATLPPTATRPPATTAPTSTPRPAATAVAHGNDDSLPQTGLGPIASVGTLLLAGLAVGARSLRHRR